MRSEHHGQSRSCSHGESHADPHSLGKNQNHSEAVGISESSWYGSEPPSRQACGCHDCPVVRLLERLLNRRAL